LTVHSNTRLVY